MSASNLLPLSISNVYKVYSQVMKELGFVEKLTPDQWNKFYTTFKNIVKTKFNHVFIQESPKQNLILMTFLTHSVDVEQDNLNSLRGAVYRNKNVNGSILFDPINNCVINASQKRCIPYLNHEFNTFFNAVCQQIEQQLQDQPQVTLKSIQMPVGLRIFMGYVNGQWNISTYTTVRINESTLIGETTIFDKVVSMLKYYNLTLDDLDVQTNYQFILSAQEYTLVPCKNQLFFMWSSSLLKKVDQSKVLQQLPRPYHKKIIVTNRSPLTRKGIYQMLDYNKQYSTHSINLWVHTDSPMNKAFEILSRLGQALDYAKFTGQNFEDQKTRLEQYLKWYNLQDVATNKVIQSFKQ